MKNSILLDRCRFYTFHKYCRCRVPFLTISESSKTVNNVAGTVSRGSALMLKEKNTPLVGKYCPCT